MGIEDVNLDERATADEDRDVCTELDDALTTFDAHRRRLFGVAYRMLSTVADAEDIVQEAWIRWQNTDRSKVHEPVAFLTTIVTRLSINVLQSSRVRRETYIGPWLPEPINTEDDPALGAERAEALQFAILLILEKLTPTERAARMTFSVPRTFVFQASSGYCSSIGRCLRAAAWKTASGRRSAKIRISAGSSRMSARTTSLVSRRP